MAAAIEVADIRLAHDGDGGLLIAILGVGWLGIAGRSSGSDGQESSNDELCDSKK